MLRSMGLGALVLLSWSVLGQSYFGQNKVQYKKLNFYEVRTPHFSVYYHGSDTATAHRIGMMAEQWYDTLSALFNLTFPTRNPIIIYGGASLFSQTDIISGLIGEGVGGVTESGMNRIVMPLTQSWQENHHVLGHELVHAFQYRLLSTGDSLSSRSMGNIPLWMTEGLAEFLSLGFYDPITTAYVRDALLNDNFPTLRQLSDFHRYFPYRWGHAFWAYVVGRWGNEIIAPLFVQTARSGYEAAIRKVLGISVKDFQHQWKEQTTLWYGAAFEKPQSYPTLNLLFRDRKGVIEQEFSPSVSPDGKRVAFLSTRHGLGLELFVARVEDGRILYRLNFERGNQHASLLRLYESAAAWSPDGLYLAFFITEKGRPHLALALAENGKVQRRMMLPSLTEALSVSWSPDGRYLAFSGLHNGNSDLYVLDMHKDSLLQLTRDSFSDLQPAWSPDGRKLVFVTDRFAGADPENLRFSNLGLAVYDLATNHIEALPLFGSVQHTNPVWTSDGSIFFLAAPDGIYNIYRYDATTQSISQVTFSSTCVCGLTELTPAFSIGGNVLVYSIVSQSGLQLVRNELSSLATGVYMARDDAAGWLPPAAGRGSVKEPITKKAIDLDSTTVFSYRPRMYLSTVSNASVGLGVSSFGTGIGGSLAGLWSDVLQEHLLIGAVQASGTIQDLGAMVGYLHQKRRLTWGLSLTHQPVAYVGYSAFYDTIHMQNEVTDVLNIDYQVLREFSENIFGQISYPFSRNLRFESGVGYSVVHSSNRLYRETYLVDLWGAPTFLIRDQAYRLEAPPSFRYATLYAALVGDNSSWGFTSPLEGYRWRLQLTSWIGDVHLNHLLADIRWYHRMVPVTLAFRSLTQIRFGGQTDALSRKNPLTIGLDYYLRGYSSYSYTLTESPVYNGTSPALERLFGSRMWVSSLEWRLPLSGPKELALVRSLALPSSFQVFCDAGVAWTYTRPRLRWVTSFSELTQSTEPVPLVSVGVSLRLNLLGAVVVEGFYAIPFQRPLRNPFSRESWIETYRISNGVWGILLVPGW
ncbi:MAG: hypothetical protein NZL95_01525 [Chitinophagales bacterium]|nr:hypothetical protein [Chitinophagales bacterium]MDW8427215.1 hypothetical protein [Chitinophagales bacterium]